MTKYKMQGKTRAKIQRAQDHLFKVLGRPSRNETITRLKKARDWIDAALKEMEDAP